MADQATRKIDAAAQKAYAEAASQTAAARKAAAADAGAAKPAVAEKIAEAAAVAAPVPAKQAAAEPAVKKIAVKKVAARKVATRKAPAGKSVAAKTVASKTAAKPAARKAAVQIRQPVPAKNPSTKTSTKTSTPKETIMTKAKETAADYTAQVKEGIADLQTRAKTAFEKGSVLASEMGEFSKHNVEAIVESGKILATGVQDMAKTYVEEGKAAVATLTSDAKEIAAVKSPTEFVQLQSQIASRNFDAAVANVSKTTEAWVKLANEAFAPISSRVSVAMDKVRKAA